MASMLLFNHHAQFKHHFTFDVQFEAVTTKATDSGLLLVPGHLSLGGRTTSKNVMANADKHYAMIVDKRGNRMDRLCDDTLGRIRDIAVADDCVMVLDWYSSNVFVFADKSAGKDYRPTSSCQEKSRRCEFHLSGNDKEDLPFSRFSKIRKISSGESCSCHNVSSKKQTRHHCITDKRWPLTTDVLQHRRQILNAALILTWRGAT